MAGHETVTLWVTQKTTVIASASLTKIGERWTGTIAIDGEEYVGSVVRNDTMVGLEIEHAARD